MNLLSKEKSPRPAEAKSALPSGMTFLLYCAGVSLLGLVAYVIFSGKGFNFSASEKGVEFKTALNRDGVPSDPVARSEKSEQIREKFAQAAAAPQNAVAENGSGNPPEAAKTVRPRTAGKRRVNGYGDDASDANNTRETPAVNAPAVGSNGDGAASTEASAEGAFFTGTWTGNGSSYVFEQNGANIALIESTNGIATSYAQGVANGKKATMTAVNISGVTFPIAVERTGKRIKLTAMGNSFFLDPQ